MKRTTYIFIGVFIAGIILATSCLLYIRSVIGKAYNINDSVLTFGQQRGRIDLSDVHTLQFFTEGGGDDGIYFRRLGKVEITSSTDGNEKMISYPESDYLKLSKEDGVLNVMLDFTLENFKENKPDLARGLSLDNLIINIAIGKELKSIISSEGFDVLIQQVQLDSLHILSKSIEVKSCDIGSLVLAGDIKFKGSASKFSDLYIDLDNTHRWNIKESNVNALHLTGSGKCRNNLSDDQYDRLMWEPKSENAELKVTLKGKSQISMMY